MYPLTSIYVTSPYGWRIHPILKVRKFHTGVDLRASYREVYATDDGVIESAEWMGAYGRAIKCNHGDYTSFYAHLSAYHCKKGDEVKAGQVIGISGNSGTYSTAPHLHFAVYVNGKDVNPLEFLEARQLEEITVHSDYFGENYEAVLKNGKTFVELRKFCEDHYILVKSFDAEKKLVTVGGGLIENLNDMASQLKKGVK